MKKIKVEKLGDIFSEARDKIKVSGKKLTLTKLAERLKEKGINVTDGYLARLENEKENKTPALKTAIAIAKELEIKDLDKIKKLVLYGSACNTYAQTGSSISITKDGVLITPPKE
jgi:transcriptional regulator with XRE-family HTH domain